MLDFCFTIGFGCFTLIKLKSECCIILNSFQLIFFSIYFSTIFMFSFVSFFTLYADFINNYTQSSNASEGAWGGAIYNLGTISGVIYGDFTNNDAYIDSLYLFL